MAGEIDEIKARIDVVDLISEYIRLKQAGTNWKGLCPFHNEKSPSFMASKDKQIWHCFGCGLGGDIFSFVQKIEGVEFAEALKILAQKAGVKLQNQNPESVSQKNRLIDVCTLAANLWHKVLLDSPKAQAARDYLAKRKIDENTIIDFKLGYAPESWDFTSTFLQSKGFKEQEIFLAGLTVKKERGGGFYDRFRDRITFPINDAHGRAVGFSARTMKADESAKYINTPQTEIYNKSVVLYNLDRAKTEIKKQNLAVIVEGQMDVISAWQAGTKNVVASSGTAMTLEQVQILKRYTNNLAIAFDADAAGQSAAKRGIDIALTQEMDVKIIVVPHGKDPDECIKQNPQDWFDAITHASSIMDYYFSQVTAHYNVTKPEDKKQAAKILLPVIMKIGNKIEQEHWVKQFASLVGASEEVIRDTMNKAKVERTTRTTVQPVLPVETKKDRHEMLSETFLALILKYPQYLPLAIDRIDPVFISNAELQTLYKQLIIYYTQGINSQVEDFAYSAFKAQLAHESLAQRADVLILLAEKDFFEFDTEAVKKELLSILYALQEGYYRREIDRLQQEIKVAELGQHTEKVTALLNDLNLYFEKLNLLK